MSNSTPFEARRSFPCYLPGQGVKVTCKESIPTSLWGGVEVSTCCQCDFEEMRALACTVRIEEKTRGGTTQGVRECLQKRTRVPYIKSCTNADPRSKEEDESESQHSDGNSSSAIAAD